MRARFTVLLTVSIVGIAGIASADVWYNNKTIEHLTAYVTDSGAGYRISLAGGVPGNPALCTGTAYLMPRPGAGAEELRELNKMLLAAHLAGKAINVRLDSANCNENQPVYKAITIQR